MPFWSDWLRSVTLPRAATASPTAQGASPAATPDDASAGALRLPLERAPARRVARVADRAPRPSSGARASPAAKPSEHDDVPLVDRVPLPLHVADERDPLDEIGHWHVRVFDMMRDGVLLFGEGGALAYRNAAATLMTDDEGLPLLREARALALTLLARGTAPRATAPGTTRSLTIGAVHYHLEAVPIPASLPRASLAPTSCEPAVLVTVARTSPALPSPSVLRQRFQLTAREASVALLLAEGRSNAGVARRLGISANTVRHYIETVLLKLDVPSRAAVAAALLGVYEHTDEHPLPRAERSRPQAARD